jgi:hypothetical protein
MKKTAHGGAAKVWEVDGVSTAINFVHLAVGLPLSPMTGGILDSALGVFSRALDVMEASRTAFATRRSPSAKR